MSDKTRIQAKQGSSAAPAISLAPTRPFAAEHEREQTTPTQQQTERLGHRFEAVDAAPRPPLRVQPRLRLGPANDTYEQEADRVAARVLRGMPAPAGQERPQAQVAQRFSTAPSAGIAVPPSVEAGIEEARGGGQPLPTGVRGPMEASLGADFGGVRVHTDARADALNQAVQARAFTTGRDIFFRHGEYQPGSNAGRGVLAHELAHVVQQALQPNTLIQRMPYLLGKLKLPKNFYEQAKLIELLDDSRIDPIVIQNTLNDRDLNFSQKKINLSKAISRFIDNRASHLIGKSDFSLDNIPHAGKEQEDDIKRLITHFGIARLVIPIGQEKITIEFAVTPGFGKSWEAATKYSGENESKALKSMNDALSNKSIKIDYICTDKFMEDHVSISTSLMNDARSKKKERQKTVPMSTMVNFQSQDSVKKLIEEVRKKNLDGTYDRQTVTGGELITDEKYEMISFDGKTGERLTDRVMSKFQYAVRREKGSRIYKIHHFAKAVP